MENNMKFSRYFITEQNEFYIFTKGLEDVVYLLITDTFSKADKSFGLKFFDTDFEPNDNHIKVQAATFRDLTDEEDAFINNFVEGLFSFKPSIDIFIDYLRIEDELSFDYPTDSGFEDMVKKINLIFKSSVIMKEPRTMNNLIQK
ncbi:hypothetical protein FD30_GL000852 [Levilactobacillus namurensis DSM 19117]|uniref:Uncharacterized protein n=2 Tax=Levilactobacillus namurensis TaxID=380393 RepID=A0A0R1JXK9_9LACO|nr:hypothetical protein FD30_GL000852 [Levilactobacillus namurensis DSM 19117]